MNLISEQHTIPEFIGSNCKPDKIFQALLNQLEDPTGQKTAMRKSLDLLSVGGEHSGTVAAKSVIDFLEMRKI